MVSLLCFPGLPSVGKKGALLGTLVAMGLGMNKVSRQQSSFRIAITVWRNRVSPVFDASQRLLIVEIEGGCVSGQYYHSFNPSLLEGLIDFLSQHEIVLLVCGAVTQETTDTLQQASVKVISFITGTEQEVLQMALLEKPTWDLLKMPGCRRKSCCRRVRRENQAGIDWGRIQGE